jgi:sugar phosphate isomerase/epimerase
MKTIKGPAIFLAQFLGDTLPFDNLAHLAGWAKGLGYEGIQVPCDPRLIDLEQAARSDAYCDDLRRVVDDAGVCITELSTHLQGQLVAVHPAYDMLFDGFAAAHVRGDPKARTAWAIEQVGFAAAASKRMTFDRFLAAVDNHPRANILFDPSHFMLQQLDYLQFIDIYHERIKAFHVKDAEFRPNGRQGVYGGYSGWVDRAGRFRSLGDGQIDFGAIFSKMAQYDFPGWAVLEWECALKHPEDGAREGAAYIREHIIRVADRAFDDFAGSGAKGEEIREVLGIDR